MYCAPISVIIVFISCLAGAVTTIGGDAGGDTTVVDAAGTDTAAAVDDAAGAAVDAVNSLPLLTIATIVSDLVAGWPVLLFNIYHSFLSDTDPK